MNILLINWRCIRNPLAGGAEVHYHEIFKRIAAKEGMSVTLLACKYPGAPEREIVDGYKIVRAGGPMTFNFFVPGAVKRLLKEKTYDVVVDDINKIPFYTPLYLKIPLAGIVHHLFKRSIFGETNPLFASYVFCAEKLIGKVYKNVPIAVVSEESKTDLIKEGIPEENLSLIYNAVDLKKYVPPVEKPPVQDTICYFGRMKRYKRIDHLLKAFKMVTDKYPDLKLKIIGDGDNLGELKTLTQDLGIQEKARFLGFLEHSEIVKEIQNSLFTVNPSIKEGWGLTIIESNACGVPVIASDSPGLRESVVDGETGILYPHGDLDALAAAMSRMIDDTACREQLSAGALKWAARFSWEASAEKMTNLLQRTVDTYKSK